MNQVINKQKFKSLPFNTTPSGSRRRNMKRSLFLYIAFQIIFVAPTASAETTDGIIADNLNTSLISMVPIMLLATLLFVPVMYDIKQSYAFEREKMENYFPRQEDADFTPENRLELCKGYKSGPTGIRGLSRSLFASSIIFILGSVLLHGVITRGFDQNVANLASLLAGSLSTIIGFYFGSKLQEQKPSKSAEN